MAPQPSYRDSALQEQITSCAADIPDSPREVRRGSDSPEGGYDTGMNEPADGEELFEVRARHKYTIRRPRALQFTYRSQVIRAGDEQRGLYEPASKSSISSNLPEDIAKERERLDLFVDLIWVGIIGNLSDVFASLDFRAENPSPGLATLVFILVFVPSWRIWDAMREFLNNYYMDDMVQRCFTFWILALSVFFGNQLAYLTGDIDSVKQYVIATYLVILGSFLAIEVLYSVWIVWLRKLVFAQWLLRAPSAGLWVAAIYVPGIKAVGPVAAAVVWEYASAWILEAHQLTDRLLPIEYRKALDVHHFQSRMANFFIIILGEGVLQLVKSGPLSLGLNPLTGIMVWVLLIYYELSFLYFNRDGSLKFLPAVNHRGRKKMLWVACHIPLFASILTFASGVMFIVRHQIPGDGDDGEQISADLLPSYMHSAVWTCAISLAIVMCTLTGLALLDKPLDPPATLKVNNRYARLAGRLLYIIIVVCIPIKPDISASFFLGAAALLLLALSIYEWNVGLDRGGALIEPKGLKLMMSRELRELKSP